MPRFHRAALALVAGALLAACGEGPTGPPLDPFDLDADGLSDDLELALLRQYRPFWDYDPGEEIWPISLAEWAALGGELVAEDGARTPFHDLAGLAAAITVAPGRHVRIVTLDDIHPGRSPCEGGGAAGPDCNDAPVYVDAQPMPVDFCVEGRCGLVWLHYWLLWHGDLKRFGQVELIHLGEWEHLCALVERDAAGDPLRDAVRLHWHHHGRADIAAGAEASGTREDPFGARHPVAFVEALTHGVWRLPNPVGARGGGGSPDDPLDNPLVFMTPHASNRNDPTDEILGGFTGRWGQSPGSPIGPLQFNTRCDHDYVPRPSAADWTLDGC